MASNLLWIRNKSGRDFNILCDNTDEPVIPGTALPSPNAIPTSIPDRRHVGSTLPPWQPQVPLRPRSSQRSPASHRSPIQLPLSGQRSSAPEMRRPRTNWDLTCDNSVADYAHDPFFAPGMRSLLSSVSLGVSARDYYHHMGEDHRYSYHNGMMRPLHGRQTSPPTPQLLRCSSRDSINTLDPASPSIPCNALPEYRYPPSRNAPSSSMGPGPMYPGPTHFEPGFRHSDGHAKPPLAPLPRFPAPHGVPMHARHYHEHQYNDPAMAAYAASQGHMVPQILAFVPPPATTVTASGTKRYPCRYSEAVGCEKTFTTSGHASRHSKIHTCGKGIQCAFSGCPKKFTRADNMKQHCETHASAAAVALRRGRRGLTRDMVRLQARADVSG
ncbi:transcriptional repressor [Pseudogymnoascus australis]